MKNKKLLVLNEDKVAETGELLCNLGSLLVPIFGVGSVFFSYINNKYMKKNLVAIVEEVNSLRNDLDVIGELTKQQERNLVFNMQNFVNTAVKEKFEEKLKLFAQFLNDSIETKMIVVTSDVFDEFLYCLEQLSPDDIRVLNTIEELTRATTITSISFTPIHENVISGLASLGTHISEKPFKQDDIYRIGKLESLGLITTLQSVKQRLLPPNSDLRVSLSKSLTIETFHLLTLKYFDFIQRINKREKYEGSKELIIIDVPPVEW